MTKTPHSRIVGYMLSFSGPKALLVDSKKVFELQPSGGLMFTYNKQKQYVPHLKWNKNDSLEIFELNELVLIICYERSIDTNKIFKRLKEYHAKMISDEIFRLKNMSFKL